MLVVAAVVAGLQAGTYFTWATGVMPGLARVDDRTFVQRHAADEHRDREPGLHRDLPGRSRCSRGAASPLCGPHARPWAIAATVLAVGTLVITFAGNIPLNDALDAAGPVDAIKDLAAVRADFESLWVRLNVARTA